MIAKEWQPVRGFEGQWYFIEQNLAGHWVQRGGPYRRLDDAVRFPAANVNERLIKRPCTDYRIVRGKQGWCVVFHVSKETWGQIAGPFRTRLDARLWRSEVGFVFRFLGGDQRVQ